MTDTTTAIMLVGSGASCARLAALAADARADIRVERVPGAPTGATTLHVPAGAVVVMDIAGPPDDRAQALDAVLSAALPDTVVAPCVSTQPVTELAVGLAHPERIVGLRLWPTTDHPRFAEVIPGILTDPRAATRVQDVCAALSLRSAVVPDRPGALLDGLLRPYLNQVVRALDEGLASAEDIDAAVHLGLGYPVGPTQLLERMGLDAHLAVCATLYEQTGDHRFAPPPLLRRLVAAGRTGGVAGGFTRPTGDGSHGR